MFCNRLWGVDIMEVSDILKLGDRLGVAVAGAIYKSMLQEIPEKDVFLVSQPTYKSVAVNIRSGQVVELLITKPDCVYTVQAKMTDLVIHGDLRLVKLNVITEPTRLQRRRHYRLRTRVDLIARIIDCPTNVVEEEMKFKTRSYDLSESGVCFYANRVYPLGTIMEVEIMLPSGILSDIKVEVMRCRPLEGDNTKQLLSTLFTDCSEGKQTRIRKFIFDEQVKKKNQVNI